MNAPIPLPVEPRPPQPPPPPGPPPPPPPPPPRTFRGPLGGLGAAAAAGWAPPPVARTSYGSGLSQREESEFDFYMGMEQQTFAHPVGSYAAAPIYAVDHNARCYPVTLQPGSSSSAAP